MIFRSKRSYSYSGIRSIERTLKQRQRRRQREHYLKMQFRVSVIISQLFRVITLSKGVLSILELNWNQRFREKKKKLKICGQVLTSSTQEQNRLFFVVERTRRGVKCTEMKNARAMPAKLLFFIVKYGNL